MSDMADAQHRAQVFNLDEVLERAREAAGVQSAAYRSGMEYVELRYQAIMRSVATAYDEALKDPNTRIPSRLGVMLLAIREDVKNYPPVVDPLQADVVARRAGL